MLPRFSIASSRRTMTPLFAMARRTARQRDADDRGKQFGRQSDGEGKREEQRLDERPMQHQVGEEDNDDDRQHDLGHQIAEAADPLSEIGFRHTSLDRRGDAGEFGSAARLARRGWSPCRFEPMFR